MNNATRPRLEPNGKCRSCHAQIHWAHCADGTSIPLDLEARAGGNVDLVPGPGAELVAERRPPEDMGTRYITHRATCPMYAARREHREAQANSKRSGVKTYRNRAAQMRVENPWKGHW